MFDVKNPKSTIYGYISQNICMTANEDGPKNFFLPKSKSKKFTPKHVKKCKLSFGIGLRQNFWEPDLRSYPAGSFLNK